MYQNDAKMNKSEAWDILFNVKMVFSPNKFGDTYAY